MVKVKNVSAVMIFSNAPDELSRWYADVFGIVTKFNEKDGWYEGEIDKSTHFGITSPEKKPTGARHSTMINYEVDDMDEFLREAKERNINITDTLDEDYGRFAHLLDPEGNPIEVWSRRTK